MAVLGAIVFTLVYIFHEPSRPVTKAARVHVPELSAAAQAGQVVFEDHCAKCHGPNAAGSSLGPPLIHKVYEPSHHGDIAIRLAVRRGVQAHHWNFGDMPRIGLSDEQTQHVIRYIRELQRANGIS
jgi:mono/diheme cytochrome c family protein